MEFIIEPERKTPLIAKADVVVVGGGPAGVGAALQAARNGQNTVLIEKCGILGGTNTSGFMFIATGWWGKKHVAAEIFDRLKPGGHIVNLIEKFPGLTSNPLNHFGGYGGIPVSELIAFDPDICAYFIFEMMEEANVKLLTRTLFVDTKVENHTIKAVIVENASGRYAVEGKVFIDATGRGDVVARSGVPYTSAENELGLPMPPGLMWKMSGVDYENLLDYQKKNEDPKLYKLIEKAKAEGELQYYRQLKKDEEMKHHDVVYTGHSHPEMCHTIYPGHMLLWMPAIYDWGLNCAEKAEDLTRAEINIRKQIISELNFLKKYVPGFEQAYLAGIAPTMGIREGRHPIGEYVLTFDDIRIGRRFDDVALRLRAKDVRDRGLGKVIFEIPYRSFLPKKIDNMLLSGDNISADHGAFIHTRNFMNAMILGEVAGIAAYLSVKDETKPKELKYQVLRKALVTQAILE
jgi:hypothetical protein